MKITALGHSAFLVEMVAENGTTVRILGDPWLTDYVIGDVMGRAPRVRLDLDAMPPLDGIYLSHSHTDHLDPYTLVPMWQQLSTKPALILPQSLAYLQPLLAEYLTGAQFIVLEENVVNDLNGVSLRGLFNLEQNGTNEDDVMMLLAETERELFLAEADAVFPYNEAEARQSIASLLDRDLDAAVFLPIKNELEALMASVHATTVEERHELITEAREEVLSEIDSTYTPIGNDSDPLWGKPQVLRLIGGQGICFPQAVDKEWNRVLFPIPLELRARMESDIASDYGHEHMIEAFQAGFTYTTETGGSPTIERCSFVEVLDDPSEFAYDGSVERFEDFPLSALRDRTVTRSELEARLLPALNDRFLPWLIGRRQPPIEHLLSAYGGSYRIRILYTTSDAIEETDYIISFEHLRFQATDADDEAQEVYWAADLDDYFDGRCDDFSTFCRRPAGGDARHFWDCLGMPYLNNDLVAKKLRFHFERAHNGDSVDSFVLPLWGS
ncbi:MAG: hypothetical protein AAF581_17555 [Planctomycetota bacterium]